MDGKLYIFGIGGTGSRVLKSLTMLLASGVEIDAKEIVPIIVDPDAASGNMTDTISSIKLYSEIRSYLKFQTGTKNKFFKTNINLTYLPNIRMVMKSNNKKFADYLVYNGMSRENQAMVSMLYSKTNLDLDMNVGFQGNPNIGSTFLNQFDKNQAFIDIVGTMQGGDRIFVISSIFGGTGASGFPLLVKNLRNRRLRVNGANAANLAPIGAITVMPYFTIGQDDNSQVDGSTFISKTKAALRYYENNLNEVNAMYYLGDSSMPKYDNHPGGSDQKNDAHFMEMMSALSIIDFASIRNEDLFGADNKPNGHIFKECGLKNDKEEVIFDDLDDSTSCLIRRPMTQFVLLSKYLRYRFVEARKQQQPWARTFSIDDNFVSRNVFYRKFSNFVTNDYVEWLKQMGNNDRKFTPFEIDQTSDLFAFVKGVQPKKLFTLKSNYEILDAWLNDERSSNSLSMEDNFVELFYKLTEKALKEKLGIL